MRERGEEYLYQSCLREKGDGQTEKGRTCTDEGRKGRRLFFRWKRPAILSVPDRRPFPSGCGCILEQRGQRYELSYRLRNGRGNERHLPELNGCLCLDKLKQITVGEVAAKYFQEKEREANEGI